LAKIEALIPGPNPTIVSYDASAVKIYNPKSSLARFENKNIFLNFKKRSSLHSTTLAPWL
jgi:hypothetical protein